MSYGLLYDRYWFDDGPDDFSFIRYIFFSPRFQLTSVHIVIYEPLDGTKYAFPVEWETIYGSAFSSLSR